MESQPKVTIAAMGDSTTAGTPGWMSPVEAPPSGEGDERSQYAYARAFELDGVESRREWRAQ